MFAPFEHQNKHLEFGSMEWRKATFKSDMDAVYESDIMVAILDGNYSDSGTAFEIGAYSYKSKWKNNKLNDSRITSRSNNKF